MDWLLSNGFADALIGTAVFAAWTLAGKWFTRQPTTPFKSAARARAAEAAGDALWRERAESASALRSEHKCRTEAEAANRAGQFMGVGEGDVTPTPVPASALLSPTTQSRRANGSAGDEAQDQQQQQQHTQRMRELKWLLYAYQMLCRKLRDRLRKKTEYEIGWLSEHPPPDAVQTEPPSHRLRRLMAAVPEHSQPSPRGMQSPATAPTLDINERLANERSRTASDASRQPGEPSPLSGPAAVPSAGVTPLQPLRSVPEASSPRFSISSMTPTPSGVAPYSPPMRTTGVVDAATVNFLTPDKTIGVVVADNKTVTAAVTAVVKAQNPAGDSAAYAATVVGTADTEHPESGVPNPQLVSLERLNSTTAAAATVAPDTPAALAAVPPTAALMPSHAPAAGAASMRPLLTSLSGLSPAHAASLSPVATALDPLALLKNDGKSDGSLPTLAHERLVAQTLQQQINTDTAVGAVQTALTSERDQYRRQIVVQSDAVEQLKRDQLQKEERMAQAMEKNLQSAADAAAKREEERGAVIAELSSTVQRLQSELQHRVSDGEEAQRLNTVLKSQLQFSQNQLTRLDEEMKVLTPKLDQYDDFIKTAVGQSRTLAEECTTVLQDVQAADAKVDALRQELTAGDIDVLNRLAALVDVWQKKVDTVREAAFRKRAKSEDRLRQTIATLRTGLRGIAAVVKAQSQQYRAALAALKTAQTDFADALQADAKAVVNEAVNRVRTEDAARHSAQLAHTTEALRRTADELAAAKVLLDTRTVKHNVELVALRAKADRFEQANSKAYAALQLLGAEIAKSFAPDTDGRYLNLTVSKSLSGLKGRLTELDRRLRQFVGTTHSRSKRLTTELKLSEGRLRSAQDETEKERARADALQHTQNAIREKLSQSLNTALIDERMHEVERRLDKATATVARVAKAVTTTGVRWKSSRKDARQSKHNLKQCQANAADLTSQVEGFQTARDANTRDFRMAESVTEHDLGDIIKLVAGDDLERRLDDTAAKVTRMQHRVTAAIERLRAMHIQPKQLPTPSRASVVAAVGNVSPPYHGSSAFRVGSGASPSAASPAVALPVAAPPTAAPPIVAPAPAIAVPPPLTIAGVATSEPNTTASGMDNKTRPRTKSTSCLLTQCFSESARRDSPDATTAASHALRGFPSPYSRPMTAPDPPRF